MKAAALDRPPAHIQPMMLEDAVTRRLSTLRAPLAAVAVVAALLAGATGCRNDDLVHKQVTPNPTSTYRVATPGPVNSSASAP